MREKYFDWEKALHHIWNNADDDGIWNGDAATLAGEFNVSEDETHAGLSDLCDRRLIQRIDKRAYIVTHWPERDEPTEEGI
jgi:hypothetical protein